MFEHAAFRTHRLDQAHAHVRRQRPGSAAAWGRLDLTRSVSVCIANWNCRDVLRKCLQALAQPAAGLDLEVIVVDNGSTDGAADMVAREFPAVRLIRNSTNRGFAQANNQAARVARGAYLFFLNNDTQAAPDAVATLVEYLEENPDANVVGPRLRGPDGRLQVSHRPQPTIATFLHRTWLCRFTGLFRGKYRAFRRRLLESTTPHDVDVLLGAALLMRRQDFWDLGGWDEDFAFGGEDMELCYRARQKGRVVYCPQAEIVHLSSQSTRANVAYATPRIAAGFVQYFRKTGASRRQLLLYKLCVTLDAPLQLIARTIQFLWRRVFGPRREASKHWTKAKGTAGLLFRGMLDFWRA